MDRVMSTFRSDIPDEQGNDARTIENLLGCVARHDEAALRALYLIAAPSLFGIARRILVRRELAEEVLQDSFVNIWRSAGSYQHDRAAPMTWMSVIVRNRALDCLRRIHLQETEWSDWLEETAAPCDSD